MSYLKLAQEMNEVMAKENGVMEAFEKYYADNVTVVEMPTGEVRDGKEAQRKAIEGWFGSVKEFHGAGVNSICSNEEQGITTVESWTDFTFQDGSRFKMEEVAVQQWKGEQIVKEQFFYNMPGK